MSMEFSRKEHWSGFPSLGYLPNPEIEPWTSALQVDSLPAEPPGKHNNSINVNYNFSFMLKDLFPTSKIINYFIYFNFFLMLSAIILENSY